MQNALFYVCYDVNFEKNIANLKNLVLTFYSKSFLVSEKKIKKFERQIWWTYSIELMSASREGDGHHSPLPSQPPSRHCHRRVNLTVASPSGNSDATETLTRLIANN